MCAIKTLKIQLKCWKSIKWTRLFHENEWAENSVAFFVTKKKVFHKTKLRLGWTEFFNYFHVREWLWRNSLNDKNFFDKEKNCLVLLQGGTRPLRQFCSMRNGFHLFFSLSVNSLRTSRGSEYQESLSLIKITFIYLFSSYRKFLFICFSLDNSRWHVTAVGRKVAAYSRVAVAERVHRRTYVQSSPRHRYQTWCRRPGTAAHVWKHTTQEILATLIIFQYSLIPPSSLLGQRGGRLLFEIVFQSSSCSTRTIQMFLFDAYAWFSTLGSVRTTLS